MKVIYLADIIKELPTAAKSILEYAGDKKIFCFYGEMGAGKTTLIKELSCQLGASDKGSSPTFALINEYEASGKPLYHLDLYRLKNLTELYDLGYEDYLFSGNYCFIEWAERMEELLPANIVKVKIEVNGNKRKISVE